MSKRLHARPSRAARWAGMAVAAVLLAGAPAAWADLVGLSASASLTTVLPPTPAVTGTAVVQTGVASVSASASAGVTLSPGKASVAASGAIGSFCGGSSLIACGQAVVPGAGSPCSGASSSLGGTWLGQFAQTAKAVLCNLSVLRYDVFTQYTTPSGQTLGKVTPAVLGVPTPVAASGGLLPDLTVTIVPHVNSTGGVGLELLIGRLATAPATFPVAVEAVITPPPSVGAPREKLSYGYDARQNSAPGTFDTTFTFNLAAVAGGSSPVVSMKYSTSGLTGDNSLKVIAGTWNGTPQARTAPIDAALGYAPMPSSAGFDFALGINSLTTQYTSATTSALTADIEDIDTTGDRKLVHGVINPLPTAVDVAYQTDPLLDASGNPVLDSSGSAVKLLSVQYQASQPIASPTFGGYGVQTAFDWVDPSGSHIGVSARADGVPNDLSVKQTSPGAWHFSTGAGESVGTVEAAFVKGGVACVDGGGTCPAYLAGAATPYAYVTGDPASALVAAGRIDDLQDASFDQGRDATSTDPGAPLTTNITFTKRHPLELRIALPTLKVHGRLAMLPLHSTTSVQLPDQASPLGAITYHGYGDAIDSIVLTATSPQGFFAVGSNAQIHFISTTLTSLPPDVTVDLGQSGAGSVDVSATPAIGSITAFIGTETVFTWPTLPPGSGTYLIDHRNAPTPTFEAYLSIQGLQKFHFDSAGAGPHLAVDFAAPQLFTGHLEGGGTMDFTVDQVPSHLEVTRSANDIVWDANATIGTITFDGSGLPGPLPFVHAVIKGLSKHLDVALSPTTDLFGSSGTSSLNGFGGVGIREASPPVTEVQADLASAADLLTSGSTASGTAAVSLPAGRNSVVVKQGTESDGSLAVHVRAFNLAQALLGKPVVTGSTELAVRTTPVSPVSFDMDSWDWSEAKGDIALVGKLHAHVAADQPPAGIALKLDQHPSSSIDPGTALDYTATEPCGSGWCPISHSIPRLDLVLQKYAPKVDTTTTPATATSADAVAVRAGILDLPSHAYFCFDGKPDPAWKGGIPNLSGCFRSNASTQFTRSPDLFWNIPKLCGDPSGCGAMSVQHNKVTIRLDSTATAADPIKIESLDECAMDGYPISEIQRYGGVGSETSGLCDSPGMVSAHPGYDPPWDYIDMSYITLSPTFYFEFGSGRTYAPLTDDMNYKGTMKLYVDTAMAPVVLGYDPIMGGGVVTYDHGDDTFYSFKGSLSADRAFRVFDTALPLPLNPAQAGWFGRLECQNMDVEMGGVSGEIAGNLWSYLPDDTCSTYGFPRDTSRDQWTY